MYDDNQLERLIHRNLGIDFSGVDLVWKYHLWTAVTENSSHNEKVSDQYICKLKHIEILHTLSLSSTRKKDFNQIIFVSYMCVSTS